MRLLHINEKRTRRRELARRNRLEGRRHAVDLQPGKLIKVFFEEAETEDPQGVPIGLDLLHDQIVVLARLHKRAVVTHRVTDPLEALFVQTAQGIDPGVGAAAGLHVEFVKRIACARGGRRAEHLDFDRRQLRVDVFPGLVGVRDQRCRIGRIRDLLGKREVHLLASELEGGSLLALGDRQTVETDLDLDDVGHTVLAAGLVLACVHPSRRVDDVRMLDTNAVAEQLHATAGSGAFDLRRLELALTAELLGNGRREGVNRGRTHDIDEVARRLRTRGLQTHCHRDAAEGVNPHLLAHRYPLAHVLCPPL